MKDKPPKNIAASVRARLLDHAKIHGDVYQRVITRYAIERLLVRLSRTDEAASYVLKGAMLFLTWPDHAFRPTGDLDLLGRGDPDPMVIKALFAQVCQVSDEHDGITFDPATLKVEPVREEDKYQGVQLTLTGALAGAMIHVQVDIGFGDHVHYRPGKRFRAFCLGCTPREF